MTVHALDTHVLGVLSVQAWRLDVTSQLLNEAATVWMKIENIDRLQINQS